MKNKNLLDKFAEKVVKSGTCWLWTGAKNNTGYGYLMLGYPKRKHISTHRLSYLLFVGPIPSNKLICHRCNVPLCCNPKHLYLGDHSTNALDTIAAGTHESCRKEKCANGHDWKNKVLVHKRWRCPICYKQSQHEAYLRRKERNLCGNGENN